MSHFITPRERGTRPVTGSTGAMQLAAAWKTVASGGTTRWATPGGTSHQPTNARRGGVAARSGRSRPVRDDLLATTPIVRVSFDRPWKSRRRIRPHRRRPGGEAPRPFQKKKLFALGGRRSAREKKKKHAAPSFWCFATPACAASSDANAVRSVRRRRSFVSPRRSPPDEDARAGSEDGRTVSHSRQTARPRLLPNTWQTNHKTETIAKHDRRRSSSRRRRTTKAEPW